jgi:hypothetical protein
MDMNYRTLHDFRDDFYACLYQRADALFELADAVLTAGAVPSPVHLSGEPIHRRGWGSLYAALVHGRLDETGVRALLAGHPLAEGQPVYAVDCSVWARCDAAASPERGFYDHPSRHSAGQPIVAGWSYQWLAQVGFARESWTAPLDVRRVHPNENASAVAVAQVARLARRLPPAGPVPLFVFDAGYDAVTLQRGLGSCRAALLVRLRSGRCFYSDPPVLPPRPQGGRPFRHGRKFVCADPTTWPTPTDERVVEDVQYGVVRIRAWAGLHPKLQDRTGHGTKGPSPIVPMTLVLVEVSRLPGRPYAPQVLWLWLHAPGEYTPNLDLLWRAYVRRFDLEHTFRFIKQTLGWHTLRVRHPEQADRWTWLVLLAYTQLRLARALVADRRLPWERRHPSGRLTPNRVRRAVPALLLALGSPARVPQPCGRSPGRPKGRRSGPAPRHPAIKKAA